MKESRREALKKLGLTSGAVWAAPVVTGLLVPRHATATSSSSSSSSTPTVVWLTQASPGSHIDVRFAASLNYSSSNSATITISGVVRALSFNAVNPFTGDASFVDNSAPVPTLVSGTTYVVTVDSTTTYNVTF